MRGGYETDRHARNAFTSNKRDLLSQAIAIQRQNFMPVCVNAFLDRQPQAARYQRRSPLQLQIVLVEPTLGPNLQHIPEAFSGYQRSFGSTALQNGICCKRSAMDKHAYVL